MIRTSHGGGAIGLTEDQEQQQQQHHVAGTDQAAAYNADGEAFQQAPASAEGTTEDVVEEKPVPPFTEFCKEAHSIINSSDAPLPQHWKRGRRELPQTIGEMNLTLVSHETASQNRRKSNRIFVDLSYDSPEEAASNKYMREVLTYVMQLIEHIDGKTAMTAAKFTKNGTEITQLVLEFDVDNSQAVLMIDALRQVGFTANLATQHQSWASATLCFHDFAGSMNNGAGLSEKDIVTMLAVDKSEENLKIIPGFEDGVFYVCLKRSDVVWTWLFMRPVALQLQRRLLTDYGVLLTVAYCDHELSQHVRGTGRDGTRGRDGERGPVDQDERQKQRRAAELRNYVAHKGELPSLFDDDDDQPGDAKAAPGVGLSSATPAAAPGAFAHGQRYNATAATAAPSAPPPPPPTYQNQPMPAAGYGNAEGGYQAQQPSLFGGPPVPDVSSGGGGSGFPELVEDSDPLPQIDLERIAPSSSSANPMVAWELQQPLPPQPPQQPMYDQHRQNMHTNPMMEGRKRERDDGWDMSGGGEMVGSSTSHATTSTSTISSRFLPGVLHTTQPPTTTTGKELGLMPPPPSGQQVLLAPPSMAKLHRREEQHQQTAPTHVPASFPSATHFVLDLEKLGNSTSNPQEIVSFALQQHSTQLSAQSPVEDRRRVGRVVSNEQCMALLLTDVAGLTFLAKLMGVGDVQQAVARFAWPHIGRAGVLQLLQGCLRRAAHHTTQQRTADKKAVVDEVASMLAEMAKLGEIVDRAEGTSSSSSSSASLLGKREEKFMPSKQRAERVAAIGGGLFSLYGCLSAEQLEDLQLRILPDDITLLIKRVENAAKQHQGPSSSPSSSHSSSVAAVFLRAILAHGCIAHSSATFVAEALVSAPAAYSDVFLGIADEGMSTAASGGGGARQIQQQQQGCLPGPTQPLLAPALKSHAMLVARLLEQLDERGGVGKDHREEQASSPSSDSGARGNSSAAAAAVRQLMSKVLKASLMSAIRQTVTDHSSSFSLRDDVLTEVESRAKALGVGGSTTAAANTSEAAATTKASAAPALSASVAAGGGGFRMIGAAANAASARTSKGGAASSSATAAASSVDAASPKAAASKPVQSAWAEVMSSYPRDAAISPPFPLPDSEAWSMHLSRSHGHYYFKDKATGKASYKHPETGKQYLASPQAFLKDSATGNVTPDVREVLRAQNVVPSDVDDDAVGAWLQDQTFRHAVIDAAVMQQLGITYRQKEEKKDDKKEKSLSEMFAEYPKSGAPFPDLPREWASAVSTSHGLYFFRQPNDKSVSPSYSHPVSKQEYRASPQAFAIAKKLSAHTIASIAEVPLKLVERWFEDQRRRNDPIDAFVIKELQLIYMSHGSKKKKEKGVDGSAKKDK